MKIFIWNCKKFSNINGSLTFFDNFVIYINCHCLDFSSARSNKMTYDEIVESIASEISRSGKFIVDPSKIRLTQHNFNLGVPMDEPIKYQSFDNLLAMLYINGQVI